MKNYYDVLRVAETASHQEIDDSYRQLIKIYHPDRVVGDERGSRQANDLTSELNAAYQVLRDPVRRAEYDRTRRPRPTPTSATRPGTGSVRPTSWTPPRPRGSTRPAPTYRPASRRGSIPPLFTEEQQRQARAARARWGEVDVSHDPTDYGLRVDRDGRPPIRTPMDLLAWLLRPFHHIGLFVLVAWKLAALGGLFLFIVSFVTSLVMLWLESHRLVPEGFASWIWQGVELGSVFIFGSAAAGILPLAWLFKLFETVNPVLYYLIGAAVIIASLQMVVAMWRKAFGLRRRFVPSGPSYCSERLSLFSCYGALWVGAVIHGILISGLLR